MDKGGRAMGKKADKPVFRASVLNVTLAKICINLLKNGNALQKETAAEELLRIAEKADKAQQKKG